MYKLHFVINMYIYITYNYINVTDLDPGLGHVLFLYVCCTTYVR